MEAPLERNTNDLFPIPTEVFAQSYNGISELGEKKYTFPWIFFLT